MIRDFIMQGAENAQTGAELAARLHCSRREISDMVRRARLDGVAIVGDCASENKGYYVADTAEEVERFCASLYRRAGEIHRTRRALLDTAQRMKTEPASGN